MVANPSAMLNGIHSEQRGETIRVEGVEREVSRRKDDVVTRRDDEQLHRRIGKEHRRRDRIALQQASADPDRPAAIPHIAGRPRASP